MRSRPASLRLTTASDSYQARRDHDRREELFGWICDHIAGERLTVKLTEDERILIVEFPDRESTQNSSDASIDALWFTDLVHAKRSV